MTPAEEVVGWMIEQLNRVGEVFQVDTVGEIARRGYAGSLLTKTKAGGLSIAQEVRDAFKEAAGEGVKWHNGSRRWYRVGTPA